MRTTTATFFLSLFGLILLLTSCGQKREPINIGGNTWLGYQPYYLAKEEFGCSACPTHDSYVGGQAFRINMMPATTSTLRLFSSGELDGALLTLDEAIGFQSRTQTPICVAQILSYSDGADAILTLPDLDPNQPFIIGNEQSALAGIYFPSWSEAQAFAEQDYPGVVARLNHYLMSYQHIATPGDIPLCEDIIHADPAPATAPDDDV